MTAACCPFMPGDTLELSRAASVQFVRPMICRLIRVLPWPTYAGWAWIEVYELNDRFDAADRRRLFVQATGVRVLLPAADLLPRPDFFAGPLLEGAAARG